MDIVRVGLIGLGNIGSHHLKYFAANGIEGAKLTAICDINPEMLQPSQSPLDLLRFSNHHDMINSGAVDMVLIAAPHYDHPPIAMDAFAKNIHVLSEKPQAVSVNAGRKLNEVAAKYPHLKYGIMFNQRTRKMYQKFRELIADGELGEISRITWIASDWFRTWTYYASGGWRAT